MSLSFRKTTCLMISTLLLAVGMAGAHAAYSPRVTKADIKAGGGTCASNLCTINGTMWNCSGGGYCSRIDS